MIRILYTLALLFCAAYTFGQAAEKQDIARLRAGMPERDALRVAGDPDKIERFKTVKAGSNDTITYWSYPNGVTVLFKNHYVERVEHNRSSILLNLQNWSDPKNQDSMKVIYGK